MVNAAEKLGKGKEVLFDSNWHLDIAKEVSNQP